jgi:hypothetical protein
MLTQKLRMNRSVALWATIRQHINTEVNLFPIESMRLKVHAERYSNGGITLELSGGGAVRLERTVRHRLQKASPG